ncbi:MAG: TfoX/Sxy family protein [Candidatus Limnocylindria bacterium]
MASEDPWRKPAPEMVVRFHAAVAGIEGLEVRKMFGFPAAFIGGNMTAGLHRDTFMVRLADEDRAERLAAGWSTFEAMPGRAMREYVTLPAEVSADVDAARPWVERAVAYVRTLPPKAPKPSKRTKKVTAGQFQV